MGLYARIIADGPTKISVHTFWAWVIELSRGKKSPAEVIAKFNLTGSEVTDFNALVAIYQGMGTGSTAATLSKMQYLEAVHAVFIMCEVGDYDEAAAKASLNIVS